MKDSPSKMAANFGENCFHIVCRGNDRQPIFLADHDFSAYLDIVRTIKAELPFHFHHYALMTNHIHMIISIDNENELPLIMQRISQNYSLYYRRTYGHSGHLWERRYRKFRITNDAYLLTCAAYIALNPVRAGMVKEPADYEYSCYRTYAFGSPNPLVTLETAYLGLESNEEARQTAYKDLVVMWKNHPMDVKKTKKFFKKQAAGQTRLHPY